MKKEIIIEKLQNIGYSLDKELLHAVVLKKSWFNGVFFRTIKAEYYFDIDCWDVKVIEWEGTIMHGTGSFLNDLKKTLLSLEPKKAGDSEAKIFIINAKIIREKYENHLYAIFNDGSRKSIFSYYPDELYFSPNQFIGKTEEQALEIYRKADIAYLQS